MHLLYTKKMNLKKIEKRLEKRFLPYFDLLFYSGGIISPLVTLPQIIKIFYYHDASGVSFLSWASYSFGAFLLLLYGIFHKQKPIVFLNAMCLPFYLVVTLGVLLYGNTNF